MLLRVETGWKYKQRMASASLMELDSTDYCKMLPEIYTAFTLKPYKFFVFIEK